MVVNYADMDMITNDVYFVLSGSPFHINDSHERTLYSRIEIDSNGDFVLNENTCLSFTSANAGTDFTRTDELFVSVVKEFTLAGGFSPDAGLSFVDVPAGTVTVAALTNFNPAGDALNACGTPGLSASWIPPV